MLVYDISEGELFIRDAAQIRAKRVRKQKTDRKDAQLLLRLLLEEPQENPRYCPES